MAEPAADDVTELLLRWNAGDQQALDRLTPLLYEDLRRLARAEVAREQPGRTLSPTGLVHEAYLRLVDQRRVRWENRAHFFGAASRIMRRVLVDAARARAAAKRGSGAQRVELPEQATSIEPMTEEVIDLDAALLKLEHLDGRKVKVVEMKCFGGMTSKEMAAALGVSDATIKRDWKLARAWLINETGGR
jgi:RNA polymerase sigma factor (TIGR02999 family)